MNKIFFGFAFSDNMLNGDVSLTRRVLELDEVKELIESGVTPVLNPSHEATIDAMRQRFCLDVVIPETPPRVTLEPSDQLIVMSVRGLPRLTDRHEYTDEEIASASFAFSLWTVVE